MWIGSRYPSHCFTGEGYLLNRKFKQAGYKILHKYLSDFHNVLIYICIKNCCAYDKINLYVKYLLMLDILKKQFYNIN